MTWIILLWIFQGYSLFSYQCSLLFLATLIYYHNHLCLSTTFLFYFASLWSGLLSLTCDSSLIITNHNSFVNIFFDKKLHFFLSKITILFLSYKWHRHSAVSMPFSTDCNAREFDSWIFKKVIAGRIKPAFFMSNFLFLYVLVCNSVV